MPAEPTVEHSDPVSEIGEGTVLGGRYRLLRLLGEGGMGRVFLALDEQDEVEVAVKVLTDDRPIPKAAARFEREAKVIARIEHDNVVRVSDVGESPRGGLYYVMEYLEGEELAETLERVGEMPWWRVRDIALQICGALQAAHEQGVVHRDLKLENCFRITRGDEEDFIKILDFGVAKLLRPEQEDRLTNTGATVGTPVYMAPELCRGKEVDHRVDVYALGVMLYELLTGHLPFQGEGFLDVALQHMNEPPPPLSRHLEPEEIPTRLEAVIQRALAKDREDRFPTMAAFGRALRKVGEPEEVIASSEAGVPVVGRGGTVPVLDAADWEPSITGRTEITGPGGSLSGPVPVTSDDGSSGSLSGPVLVAAPGAEPDETPPRSRAWLVVVVVLLLLGGGVGGVLAWWSQSTPEPEGRVAAVEPGPEPATTGGAGGDDEASTAVAASADVEGTESTGEVAVTEPGPVARPRKGLGRAQIDAGVRKVRPKLKVCASELMGAKRGDTVRVTLRIDRSTGTVVSATAEGPTTAAEDCVVRTVKQARFPSVGKGIQTVHRTLRL